MSDIHSTYKGWTIWTRSITGWWSATHFDRVPLKADTLRGLKQLITATEAEDPTT